MTGDADDLYANCVLPLDTTTIRVLDLMPGYGGDQIQGSLRLLQIDTDPSPQYDCVSYVWGDRESAEHAIINQRAVKITHNLSNCLRQIRSKVRTTPIWADAICINQLDLDEKSRQVALMVKVFRKCSKVHIWLGTPEAGALTGNPFKFLEHWVTGRHFYDLPGFYRDPATGLWSWRKNEVFDNLLDDFLQVAGSEWFTRAWTVQECLLPEDKVINFGAWTVTWEFMLKAEAMKNSHVDNPAQCCKQALSVFSPRQLPAINEWMWQPSRGQKYMDVFRKGNWSPKFHEAVLAFSSRRSSDPRDKIYSMLALATHPVYKDFRPDYQEEPSKVYVDIFTRMVRETNGDFACFMGGGFGSSMPGLPSWVRDFSQSRRMGVVAVEERRMWNVWLYQASTLQPYQLHWNENRELFYRGTYAESVKSVGPNISVTDKDDLRPVLRQWFGSCREAMGTCDLTVVRNSFSRVICADVCKHLPGGPVFRRAKRTDFLQGDDAWDRLLDGDLEGLDMRGYGWGVNFAVRGRCFFTTASGKMGLCHPNTIPGDEVWIMSGVRVPFILRALGPGDPGCAKRHSFLGDCFLNGIMDGELSGREKLMERPIMMV